MLKYISLLLILGGLVPPAFTQEIPQNPNLSNENGARQGKWTILFDKDWEETTNIKKASFYRLANYENGKLVGEITDYFKSGKVQMKADSVITEIPNNKYHGKVYHYDQESNVIAFSYYLSGILEPDSSARHLQDIVLKYHQDTLKSIAYEIMFSDLAYCYELQGQYDLAIKYYTQVLNVREHFSGKTHKEYLFTFNKLAVNYINNGLYLKAEKLFLNLKNELEQKVGKKHPTYINFLSKLSELYGHQGLFKKALDILLYVKKVQEKRLDPDNEDYLTTLNNLAYIYQIQGFYTLSDPIYLQIIDTYEKIR